jgi:NADH:ubiquinone oxidoreductase subunit 5 (subunit L)/multisubunit Na+/H+ antiporter MnhA subunit
VGGWTAIIVGLPLLAAVLLVTAFRHVRPPVARRAVLLVSGLAALSVLALLRRGNTSIAIAREWLPGTGPLGLEASPSGLSIMLVTTAAACLVLANTTWHPERRAHQFYALMLLAMSAANAALLADHFLGRYATLEVVALCVGLVPLATLQGQTASRLAWQVYLPLRIGDAAMLVAILILGHTAGTLHIRPALETAGELGGANLTWVLAGLAVAAWAKLGGWPFSMWVMAGRQLSLASHAWLYATLVPNLGAYLLYRIAPLLALAGPLSTTLAWVGAGGAALSALAALIQRDVRTALVSVGAIQAGLALFAAAAGLQPVLLLGILALTPLRLSLYLSADAAQQATTSRWRRVGAALFGLSGLALSAFSLLTAWWLRHASGQNAGLPIGAIYVAESAIALGVVWVASATRWLAMAESPAGSPDRGPARAGWRRWSAAGLLSVTVLAGGLAFGPLSGHIATAWRLTLPSLPSLPDLLRYAARTPALLATVVIGIVVWMVRWRFVRQPAMRRAEGALRAAFRAGSAESVTSALARLLAHTVRIGRTIEHQGLDVLVRRTAQAVTGGARVAHRWVEQEGLEGLLRAAVRAVLGASRALQRQHTGRLRHNAVWLAVALALAVVCLAIWRW